MTLCVAFARSTALAALLALPWEVMSATAQQEDGSQEQITQEQIEQADTPDTAETDTASTGEAMGGPVAVVVTVGDAEILISDVMRAIGTLPQPMRKQTPEMLLPMALQHLVLRELMLNRARGEYLPDGRESSATAEQANPEAEAEENALVQFWLRREMARIRGDLQTQESGVTFAGRQQDEAACGDGFVLHSRLLDRRRHRAADLFGVRGDGSNLRRHYLGAGIPAVPQRCRRGMTSCGRESRRS